MIQVPIDWLYITQLLYIKWINFLFKNNTSHSLKLKKKLRFKLNYGFVGGNNTVIIVTFACFGTFFLILLKLPHFS